VAVSDQEGPATSGLSRRPLQSRDATELGDLLDPGKGSSSCTGFAAKGRPATSAGRTRPSPITQQASLCFAMDYLANRSEDTRLSAARRVVRLLARRRAQASRPPPWPGKLLSLSMSTPVTLKPRAPGVRPLVFFREPERASGFGSTAASPTPATRRGHLRGGNPPVNWPQRHCWAT